MKTYIKFYLRQDLSALVAIAGAIVLILSFTI